MDDGWKDESCHLRSLFWLSHSPHNNPKKVGKLGDSKKMNNSTASTIGFCTLQTCIREANNDDTNPSPVFKNRIFYFSQQSTSKGCSITVPSWLGIDAGSSTFQKLIECLAPLTHPRDVTQEGNNSRVRCQSERPSKRKSLIWWSTFETTWFFHTLSVQTCYVSTVKKTFQMPHEFLSKLVPIKVTLPEQVVENNLHF